MLFEDDDPEPSAVGEPIRGEKREPAENHLRKRGLVELYLRRPGPCDEKDGGDRHGSGIYVQQPGSAGAFDGLPVGEHHGVYL